MYIDMHMHERTFSKDSFLSLEEIVTIARKKGLDGICITDHDSMGLKEYAENYSQKTGFPIFVGVEYFSLQGDIVTFGIDSFPNTRIGAQEYIDMVNQQGGICFSAHPFRNNNRGLEENLKTVKGLTGVEVFNGSTSTEANQKAYEYAKMLGLQAIGASDCHVPEKVGCFATYLPVHVTTVKELVTVFKTLQSKPAVFNGTGYQIIDYHACSGSMAYQTPVKPQLQRALH